MIVDANMMMFDPIYYDFWCQISATLKTHLSEINVQVAKEGKRDDMSSYLRLKTTKTDWRGQRAKRRLLEKGPSCKKMKLDTDEDMDIEESVKLDCQLYLNKKEDKVAFQFVFLNGEVGKGGMAELVQYVKRNLNICSWEFQLFFQEQWIISGEVTFIREKKLWSMNLKDIDHFVSMKYHD